MQAIEDDTIVSGTVTGDNLILTKKGGGTVNAGNVRGEQGIPGPINQTALDNAIAASHPGCVLTTSANQSGPTTSGSWWNISWNGVDLRDTGNLFHPTPGSDVINIPYTGWYLLSGSIVYEASVVGPRMVRYTIGGIGDNRLAAIGSEGMGAFSCRVPFAQEVFLNSGDLLRISGRQVSGGQLNILAGCNLAVRFLSAA
jgi:hypothetical protein